MSLLGLRYFWILSGCGSLRGKIVTGVSEDRCTPHGIKSEAVGRAPVLRGTASARNCGTGRHPRIDLGHCEPSSCRNSRAWSETPSERPAKNASGLAAGCRRQDAKPTIFTIMPKLAEPTREGWCARVKSAASNSVGERSERRYAVCGTQSRWRESGLLRQPAAPAHRRAQRQQPIGR